MAKQFTLFVLLCFTVNIYAQDAVDTESVEQPMHEVKVDGLKLLAGPIFESSYEFVKNKNSGFGASLLINFDGDNDYFEDFSLTPFYRMYFFNKRDYGASGFFVEGFGKLSTGDNPSFGIDEDNYDDYTDFSLGMSLGKKWVNSNGFVFEILFGVGRPLTSTNGPDGYVRGGLFVGYRF